MNVYSNDYALFMEDAYNEAYNEMIEYFRKYPDWLFEAKDDDGEDDGSNAVYKINYYFRDNLQIKYVTPVLQKARNRNLIIDFTAKFMDDHHQALSAPGPVYSFTFGKNETEFFYELFGINDVELLRLYDNMINETYYGKISAFITGFIKNAPHKLLITAILIDALQNGYDDIVEACEYLWAFCEYPILFNDYWKIGVNEEVMKHTIEHLPGKFKIVTKKLDTLLKLLKYDANSAISPYKEPMRVSGADHLYIEVTRRMRNQLKSTLKNIARLYYKNAEENNTQHQSVTEFDDGTMADQDGINSNIAQAVEKTVSKFASGEINSTMVRIVAEYSQIDKGNLSGYLAQIFATKNNKVGKFVEDIITLYFTKNPANTSLDSKEFINFGLALYRSIGTSKDTLMAELRQILNFWMNDIINIQSAYNRPATITNYTRGIFNYFVMMIKYYN